MDMQDYFKALSDNSRLRIVNALVNSSLNVQELTDLLELGQSTVSHHLKVLAKADITKQAKDGTWIYYSLNKNNSHITELINSTFNVFSKLKEHSLKEVFLADESKIKLLQNKRREQTKDFFESSASKWHKLRKEDLSFSKEATLDLLAKGIKDDSDVLELGVGSGALLDKILPRKGKTIAVDYSEAMLNNCKELLGERQDDVDLRLGYLEHLPLADNVIDEAVSYMVFHYLSEPTQVFKSAYRVLKPGGTLKVIDLNKHDNESFRERFAHTWLGFKEETIVAQAKEAGFLEISFSSLEESSEAFLLTCIKGEKHE